MPDHVIDTDAGVAGEREHEFIVPRITIEAFCSSADFATVMQTAASDRRMARAKTSIGMGGVAAAAKRYSQTGMPNLVIVESQEAGFAILGELEALAEVSEADARVMVAGPSNDVTLYRELMRQGVAEYLVTPSSPMQVIEAITGAFEQPGAAPSARTIAVFGVGGGVGASSIAHNLAFLLSDKTEKDTVLVDLDLEFGSAALNFNIETKNTIAEALADVDTLDETKLSRLFHKHSETLRLLTSPASLNTRSRSDEEAILNVLDIVRATCDFAVLDTPHRGSEAVRCVLRQADQTVMVATPNLLSLRNVKTAFDWLRAERPHDRAPLLALNYVGEPRRPEIPAREFEEIVGGEIAMVWPYDPATFGAAQNDGRMATTLAGGKRHLEALVALSDQLLGRAARSRSSKGLSLTKLLRPFSG